MSTVWANKGKQLVPVTQYNFVPYAGINRPLTRELNNTFIKHFLYSRQNGYSLILIS